MPSAAYRKRLSLSISSEEITEESNVLSWPDAG